MKKKILIFTVTVIFFSIILSSSMTFLFVKDKYLKHIESSLISDCNLINNFIKKDTWQEFDFIENAYVFSKNIGARVTFIDIDGKVIGDSGVHKDKLKDIENHRHREEVKEAITGHIGKAIRHSHTVGIDYMYIAVTLSDKGEIYGITRLAFPLYEIKKLNDQIIGAVVFSSIAALVSAIILSIFYSGKVTRPITHLTNFATKIADGNYNQNVYIKTGDEIEVLGNTLNDMGKKLNKTIKEMEDNNSKLSSTLFSMKEAMIAVDMDYKIIMINHSAKDLFNIGDDVVGQYILKVIRNHRLHQVFEKMLQEQYIGKQEIEFGEEEILKINTSYIRSVKDQNVIGVLALIENITQIKKLENMRKDFVANVSHELRTPLTSISGFLETLQNGAAESPEVRNKFLDIISIETARLKRLIEDLLILSDIESGKDKKINQEITDIKRAISDVMILLDQEIKKKELEINIILPEEELIIQGSVDRFKQMMLNLIDNAIKYSYEKGKIEISAKRKLGNVIICIKDEGIGISQNHQKRLFERFYRVDKARSKKVGGTGLGLAIVKHIVILFNGEIKVKSIEKKGTTFTVVLPDQNYKK